MTESWASEPATKSASRLCTSFTEQRPIYRFDKIKFLPFLNLLQEENIIQCFFSKLLCLYLKIGISLDNRLFKRSIVNGCERMQIIVYLLKQIRAFSGNLHVILNQRAIALCRLIEFLLLVLKREMNGRHRSSLSEQTLAFPIVVFRNSSNFFK